MGLDKLIDGYRAIMKQIYSPRQYYQRVRRILGELKTPVATTPFDRQRILAFWRAGLRLGVLGKDKVSVLAAVDVDLDAQTQTASLGGYHGHLRLLLPEGVRVAYFLNKKQEGKMQ